MPYLIISLGGLELSRHPLLGPTILGRSVDADIHIRDSSLSRWHCRFEPAGDPPNVWTVVDLGSRNGTSVNGRRVQRIVLHPGDLLRVGRVTLAFHAGDLVPPTATFPRDRHTLSSRSARPDSPPTSAQLAPAAHGFAKPLLIPETRLPRPDPGQTAPSKNHTPDLELMSSPGWSRQTGKKPPSPSIDPPASELSPLHRAKTVDLAQFPQPENPQRPTPPRHATAAGPLGWLRRWLAWITRR